MRNKPILLPLLLSTFFLATLHTEVRADGLRVTQNANGPTGLVLMPTARMYEDGEFSVLYSSSYPYSQYVVSAQPLPWLQALFKYTDIATKAYGASTTGQTLKDKSIDIKVRLLKESYFLPEIALGINDVGGTGLFSGEYIAASKQVKNLDFSLGVGWGYLGKQGHFTNPLSYLSSHFKSRKGGFTGSGGEFSAFKYFTGEKVALFGGAEYHFEDWPLVAKVEYDANNYVNDPGGTLKQALPFNFGAVYSFNKHVDLHAGVVRGNTAMLGISFRTNLKSNGPKKFFDPEPVEVNETTVGNSEDEWQQVVQKIQVNSGLAVESIHKQNKQLVVEAKPKSFQETAQGLGRAARVLVNQAQLNDVNDLVFVEKQYGKDIFAIKLDKKKFTQAAKLEIDSDNVVQTAAILPGQSNKEGTTNQVQSNDYLAKRTAFDYQIVPFFKGSYGGPDAFLLYQLGINANANYFMRDNSWLSGTLELGLADNYEVFNTQGITNLHPVRTDMKEYMKTSKLRLANLQINDFEKLGDNFFALGYAGYLESMYAGIGAELLYRPLGKWAVGADINYVKQREFDQRFGLRDYSVTTGHLTGYYENDDDMLFKLSAGRYLAKDTGVTLDVSRKFRSGARLGFWATKTNVSAEDFGEGSFDKGFYMSFPMNLFTFKSTRDTASFKWQFLTRDGGQKLRKKYELYDITDSRSLGFVKDSFDKVLH